jgi:hypothetical protein
MLSVALPGRVPQNWGFRRNGDHVVAKPERHAPALPPWLLPWRGLLFGTADESGAAGAAPLKGWANFSGEFKLRVRLLPLR